MVTGRTRARGGATSGTDAVTGQLPSRNETPLAADHRVLDGATGAELLAAFRQLVEDPLLLLL